VSTIDSRSIAIVVQLIKVWHDHQVIQANQVWHYNCFKIETIIMSNLIGQNHPVNQSNYVFNWMQAVGTFTHFTSGNDIPVLLKNCKQSGAKIRTHLCGTWSWFQTVCPKHYTLLKKNDCQILTSFTWTCYIKMKANKKKKHFIFYWV